MIFKRHWLNWTTLLAIAILSLIISLSIGITLGMYDLIYTVLLTISFVSFSWLIKTGNEIHLEKLVVDRNKNKKKIKVHSIIFSTLAGIIYVMPMIMFIIFMAYGMNIINVYMLATLYVVIVTDQYTCLYLESKREEKKDKTQEQGKES